MVPSLSPSPIFPSNGRAADRGLRVLHYCQHSTGLGHLVRSLAVAGALAASDEIGDVVLCSGGQVPDGLETPPGVTLVPLPAVGTGTTGLQSLVPGLTLEQAFEARRHRLQACAARLEPDVIVVELFPFGRRKFAAELVPLLVEARSRRPRPLVVCSVRDLLVRDHPDKQHHDDRASVLLDAYFDAVVVHGDPRFARLEESFRPVVPPRTPILYSGFVSPDPAPVPAPARRPRQVVVSAGGGRVGGPLFEAAVEAHRTWRRRWGLHTRLVTGPFLPEPEAERLAGVARSTEGLTVERFSSDLRQVIAESTVSVSQCGYNTSLDLLLAGTPAVVVPYGAPGEDEQPERARRLAALGLVDVLPLEALTPASLAGRIDRLVHRPRGGGVLDVHGAARTVEIVTSLARRTEALAS